MFMCGFVLCRYIIRGQPLKATQIKPFYGRNNILFLAVMSSFPCFSVSDKIINLWSEDKQFQVCPSSASVPNTLQSSVFKGLKYVWNQIFTLCSFLSCCCCNVLLAGHFSPDATAAFTALLCALDGVTMDFLWLWSRRLLCTNQSSALTNTASSTMLGRCHVSGGRV